MANNFTDLYLDTLQSTYLSTDTTLTVSDASSLTAPTHLVIFDRKYGNAANAYNSSRAEIVLVTSISTNDLTVTRGIGDTTAIDFDSDGDWSVVQTWGVEDIKGIPVVADTISDLIDVDSDSHTQVLVEGFYSGDPFEDSVLYTWNSGGAKSTHDGWSSINPDHLSTIGSDNWYSSTGDATDDSGSGVWERDVVGWANVREAGAKGDNSNDDTTAFEAAQGQADTIYVPSGHYLINMTLDDTDMVGESRYDTFIESFTSSGYSVSLHNTSSWERNVIKQLYFIGDDDGNYSKNGIQFGRDPYVSGDEYVGRYEISDNTFEFLGICIYKPYGNIGNIIYNNAFEESNYHYWAENGSPEDAMHSGNDIFNINHFRGAQKAAVYVDGSSGQTIFRDNIFEENVGFCFFVKNSTSDGEGFEIKNNWLEDNATASSVTVDGTTYTPPVQYRFENSDIRLDGIRFKSFELVASHVYVETVGGSDTNFSLTKDSDSSFIIERFESSTRVELSTVFSEVIIPRKLENTQWYYTSTKHPTKTTRAYQDNLIYSESYNKYDSYTPDGAFPIVGDRVRDGVLFDSCIEFESVDNTEKKLVDAEFTLVANKYHVASFSYKKVSGIDGTLSIPGYLRNVQLDSTEWQTVTAIGKPTTSPSNYLAVDATSGGTTVFRIGHFQILSFDTIQEAYKFANSGQFQLADDYNTIMYGSSAPTNGTWEAGDIVIDTDPTSTSVGWKCITGGTSGTWEKFGSTVVEDTVNLTFQGSTSGSISVNNVPYRKDGNEVTIYFRTSNDLTSLSGNIELHGLPYACDQTSATIVSHGSGITYPTNAQSLYLFIATGDSDGTFYFNGSGIAPALTDSDITGLTQYTATIKYKTT